MGQWEIQVNSQTTYVFDIVSFYGISGTTVASEPKLKGANDGVAKSRTRLSDWTELNWMKADLTFGYIILNWINLTGNIVSM